MKPAESAVAQTIGSGRWSGPGAARAFVLMVLLLLAAPRANSSDAPGECPAPPVDPASMVHREDTTTKIDKRVFGVLPNYRTADGSLPFEPINRSQKMTIALKDSFDWPLALLGAAYAGIGQLSGQNAYLGQGAKGYAGRFVRNYADQALGNMLTEGVLPSLLHADPRYFRRGEGKFWNRLGYASSRILVTRTDSGRNTFNISEFGGNAAVAAISTAYYADTRNVSDASQKLIVELATDAFSNVLKEFWPDVKRRLFARHSAAPGN